MCSLLEKSLQTMGGKAQPILHKLALSNAASMIGAGGASAHGAGGAGVSGAGGTGANKHDRLKVLQW